MTWHQKWSSDLQITLSFELNLQKVEIKPVNFYCQVMQSEAIHLRDAI